MVDVAAALASAKKVDDALGVVGKLVSKLKSQPTLAALKLGQALEEIAKTYQVLDGAISTFLGLAIEEGALQKNSKVLFDIEGGRLSTEVERGRGHCHVIGNIYYMYLDRWFGRVLKPDEHARVRNVFADLGNADDDIFADMVKVSHELESEAGVVLDLVTKGLEEEGRHRLLGIRRELKHFDSIFRQQCSGFIGSKRTSWSCRVLLRKPASVS